MFFDLVSLRYSQTLNFALTRAVAQGEIVITGWSTKSMQDNERSMKNNTIP
jgi:hypothetical protein